MNNEAEETLRRANLALLSQLVRIYNNRFHTMFNEMNMEQLDDFNTAVNEALELLQNGGVK